MSSNLTTVSKRGDLDSSSQDFFNNFYQPGFTISPAVDEAVISYFERITENLASARLLASSVVYTSMAQRVSPMEILDRFKDMSQEEITGFAAMFLNLNRVGTSYLGISNRPKTNKYVQRSILP
jgi:hypothetical protein